MINCIGNRKLDVSCKKPGEITILITKGKLELAHLVLKTESAEKFIEELQISLNVAKYVSKGEEDQE